MKRSVLLAMGVLGLWAGPTSAIAETPNLRPSQLERTSAIAPTRPTPPPPSRAPSSTATRANAAQQARETEKKADAPKPDQWSRSAIHKAQAQCKRLLQQAHAIAVPVTPIKSGPCGDPAPVRLMQLGKLPVTFKPAPTVNCRMVARLARWLDRGLQPLAQRHIGARIDNVIVMSSYSCRNAYGRKSTRLSEHARANALDIAGFGFADGLETRLLAHWGPTRRDLARQQSRREKARAVEKQPLPSRRTATAPQPKPTPPPHPDSQIVPASMAVSSLGTRRTSRTSQTQRWRTQLRQSEQTAGLIGAHPPLPVRRPSLKQRTEQIRLERLAAERRRLAEQRRTQRYRAQLERFLYRQDNLGGPGKNTDRNTRPRGHANANRQAFLKAAWKNACRYFGTVLGPEANAAHRNHFHVDLSKRRRANYCR